RPTLFLPNKGLDFLSAESAQWVLTHRGATLTANFSISPARGQLFELRFRLPKVSPGYQIDSIDLKPATLLKGWRIDGGLLVVELTQPLTPAQRADLKVQLRSAFREIATGPRTLSYPELEPLDVTKREGELAIFVDPMFRPHLKNSSVPLAPIAE